MAPPTGAIPPPLPPSVEEAYRRKCQQLKRRMNEVEESNDAAYLRVTRLRREIEKLRLERSFLLEQLSKRTPTNVEDSEGSPSPPPTPKDKPLRTKRGHRKPDLIQNLAPSTSLNHQGSGGFLTLSPTSETFSQNQNQESTLPRGSSPAVPNSRNGHASQSTSAPSRPKNAFEQYCNEVRPKLISENGPEIAAGTFNVEKVLAEGFQGLSQAEKDAVHARYEALLASAKDSVGERTSQGSSSAPVPDTDAGVSENRGDEDVEMGDDAADSEAGGSKTVT